MSCHFNKWPSFNNLRGWDEMTFYSSASARPLEGVVKYFNIVLSCAIEIFVFLWAFAYFFLGGGGLTSQLSLSLAFAANTGVLDEVKLVSAFLILKMGNRGFDFTFELFKFSLLLLSLTSRSTMGFPKHSLLSSSTWSPGSGGGTTLGLFVAELFSRTWYGEMERYRFSKNP